jgi:hypothetical protein
MLTASYPQDSNLETWVAQSKAHIRSNNHSLHTYVFGLSLTGVDRAVLRNNIVLRTQTSSASENPGVSAAVPSGFAIIGGGARSNWASEGQLLTESYPASATTWRASAKDHIRVESASVTAYAIGISTGNIPGFGTIQTQLRNASVSAVNFGTATRSPTSGWATTCAGGRTIWGQEGLLLFRMAPTNNSNVEIQSSAKAHIRQESGTVFAYAVEARRTP